ncbi:MAG: proton-conducting transporter membrane subunit [Desulfuromonadaceae bacterium]|nr:proton-conducting transporter membrane subunit [Desulfuromonadaceae bacterium]
MNSMVLMQLCILVPLVGALLIGLSSRAPNIREGVTLMSAALLFAVVCGLYLNPDALTAGALVLAEPIAGIAIKLELEPLGLLFAGIASLLWLITSLYTIGYMRANNEQHQTRLYVCFAIALASTMGIALAGNLFTLFIFYETLTLSTYPLVAHNEDEDAVIGGRYYLGILVSTSIGLLLPAIIWVWYAGSSIDFVPGGVLPLNMPPASVWVLLFLFAFGIGKAALMPIHRWLPEAMVAPTPVSALLHAVAVVKAGVFCLLKVVVYIFGSEILLQSGANILLIALASVTIVAASLIALRQDNLKRRLAYSTVSQLSYITLAGAILTPVSTTAAMLHMAAHAFGKITLFFGAGAIYTAAHKTRVSELNGIGKRMPWTMGAFAIATLSMIGVPPAGGFISKWYLFQGIWTSGYGMLLLVLLLSTLLNCAYFIPIVHAAFFRPETYTPEYTPAQTHGEAPWTMVLALCITATLSIVLFCCPDIVVQLARLLHGGG